MIKYITENDKNGKPRYYKVIEGKKKVVSRDEYEANVVVTEPETVNVEENTNFAEPVSICEIHSDTKPALDEAAPTSDDDLSQSDHVIINADSEIGAMLADVVNSILCAGSKKPKAKVAKTKKYIVVNYQKCMVLSLAVSESGTVTAIRFKGTDKENRKDVRSYPFNKATDMSRFKDEIVKQIEFIEREHSVKKLSDEQQTA